MVQISISEIGETSRIALIKHGASGWIASYVADAVAKAESIGNRICGLYYLESYCQQLQSGRVNGKVEPIVTNPKAGSVYVDAGMGFAQPAFARGLPTAVDLAEN
jgi:(2R)-3-sulfolactate dehydrogenase (NADP+)